MIVDSKTNFYFHSFTKTGIKRKKKKRGKINSRGKKRQIKREKAT